MWNEYYIVHRLQTDIGVQQKGEYSRGGQNAQIAYKSSS